MELINTEHEKIALKFATFIANGEFLEAHEFLAEQQKFELSLISLKEKYEEMIEYGEGPVDHIEVMTEMTEWPAKKDNDLGWAYVAMSGSDYSEGMAIVVCHEKNQLKIREIEWGRP